MVRFDLALARFSFLTDALAYLSTIFASSSLGFTASTSLSALAGAGPSACQSALVSLHASKSVREGGEGEGNGGEEAGRGTGGILGAVSMVQAAGQIFGVRAPHSHRVSLTY